MTKDTFQHKSGYTFPIGMESVCNVMDITVKTKRFYIGMRAKNKKTIFICQVTENSLKVIKCLIGRNCEREFVDFKAEAISSDTDDKNLSGRLNKIFEKLEYSNNPVVVSLSRSQATCRYLKIPSFVPGEIEKIAGLQAPHYLPYPIDELITGYQIIQTDRQGYSDVNLVIAHRPVIERYTRIFKELKTTKLTIVLSSYGLCNFYGQVTPQEPATVMVVDVDSLWVEVAIICRKKLLFSRSFKIDRLQSNWENLFIDEMSRTRDAYLKEVSGQAPSKIIIFDAKKFSREFIERLNRQTALPVEVLSYNDKINIAENLLNKASNSDNSFVSLIGLGLEDVTASLNLLPQDMKEKARRLSQSKERLRLVLLISVIILIWSVAIARNLDNKAKYLQRLKTERDKIAKEAGALEEIEKRFQILANQTTKKPSSLDILYELHRIITDQISLINFIYEEDNQITLRGQASELSPVFTVVLQLEKSPLFKKFNIKVRYATKKKTQTGEIVDFEIICLKK